MRIEIFYIDGCPNHQQTVDRVKEALEEVGLAADVVETEVVDAESAIAKRFLGSPTVQINGVDMEASARASNCFGVMCRTYFEGRRRVGVPPLELVRQALVGAHGHRQADITEAQ